MRQRLLQVFAPSWKINQYKRTKPTGWNLGFLGEWGEEFWANFEEGCAKPSGFDGGQCSG